MRSTSDPPTSRDFAKPRTVRAFDDDAGRELTLRHYIRRSLDEYITKRALEMVADLTQRSVELDPRGLATLHLVSEDGAIRRKEQTSLIIATWGSLKSALRNWDRGREVHWVWKGQEPKDLYLLTESGVKPGDTVTFRLGAPRASRKRASASNAVVKAQGKKIPGKAKKAPRK